MFAKDRPLPKFRPYLSLIVLVLSLGLIACDGSRQENKTDGVQDDQQSPETSPNLAINTAHFPQRAHDIFIAVSAHVEDVQKAYQALLEDPSRDTLLKAQQQWRIAHESFTRYSLVAAIYYQPKSQASILHRIDAWPIQGGYLDHVNGYPVSGIVHDMSLPLTKDFLVNEFGFSDSTFITLGFHALEFLLWGDQSEDGQGTRTAADFSIMQLSSEQLQAGLQENQLSNNRRRHLGHLIVEQLFLDTHELATKATINKAAPFWQQRASEKERLNLIVTHLDQWQQQWLTQWTNRNASLDESHAGYSQSQQTTLLASLASFSELLELFPELQHLKHAQLAFIEPLQEHLTQDHRDEAWLASAAQILLATPTIASVPQPSDTLDKPSLPSPDESDGQPPALHGE